MTKHQISDLLDELQNDEAYKRNDAIKKIIKEKINDEQIIDALKNVVKNDSSISVRDFALAALDVFGAKYSTADAPKGEQKRLTKELNNEPNQEGKERLHSLIKKLQSTDHNIRYDACEALRVSRQPLPWEAIDALQLTTNDSNLDVADAARRALALHTESKNDELEIFGEAPKDLPFWSNRKKKLRSILFIAIVVFVFTLPYSLLAIIFFRAFFTALVNFPLGLFYVVSSKLFEEALSEGIWESPSILVLIIWIFYIGIASAIVQNNNRKVVTILYVILILLIILNVAGCQIIAPGFLAD